MNEKKRIRYRPTYVFRHVFLYPCLTTTLLAYFSGELLMSIFYFLSMAVIMAGLIKMSEDELNGD